MYKPLLIPWLLLLFFRANSQQVHTLEALLAAANNHVPTAQQLPLIEAANRAALAQLKANYLPQATLNGQATWQSEVTSLPIQLPNFEAPTLSKDQYRFTLDLVQPIWDGGQTARQSDLQSAQSKVEQQRVEVDRYALREQLIQLYCAALLAQKQAQSVAATQKDIANRRARIQEQVNNGTAIPANVLSFDARLLELEQLEEEALARRASALDGLALLSGNTLSPTDSLVPPAPANTDSPGDNQRPELTLFGLQQASAKAQENVINTRNMPRVNAIATLGYARPGLNFLSNEFQPYAILGVNFKWNLAGFYNGIPQKEKQQLQIQSERISLQREQFVLLNNVKSAQYARDIERIRKTLDRDNAIVRLREQVSATAATQLENGVLTPSEYLTETTNATAALINKHVHEIQLLQAQLMLAFVNGKI